MVGVVQGLAVVTTWGACKIVSHSINSAMVHFVRLLRQGLSLLKVDLMCFDSAIKGESPLECLDLMTKYPLAVGTSSFTNECFLWQAFA